MEHNDFNTVVQENWRNEESLPFALSKLAGCLHEWNRRNFVNIFVRKRWLQRRLTGVQKKLASSCTPGLLKLEAKLSQRLNDTLHQEEILWMQKSRINWFRLGDKNTRFFHTPTLIRRQRNKMESLKDKGGNWMSDQQRLKDIALNYFSSLFQSDSLAIGVFLKHQFPPISPNKRLNLEQPCSDEEVGTALKGMAPYKAHGLDGFHAAFFQQTWSTTEYVVTSLIQWIMRGEGLPTEIAEVLIIIIPKIEHSYSIN